MGLASREGQSGKKGCNLLKLDLAEHPPLDFNYFGYSEYTIKDTNMGLKQ